MKWKHDDLQDDLAKHLSSPERMIWQNMQIGPSGSPRPDVYSINKSYSKPNPISYEIKVSKSDFLSDMKNGKWQAYLQFSSAVVFCAPSGLVTKNEIPAGCGLMVRGENGWSRLKAPRIELCNIPMYAMLKLLIDGVERNQKSHIKKMQEEWIINNGVSKKIGETVGNILRDRLSVQNETKRLQDHINYRIGETDKERKRIISDAHREADYITSMRNHLIELLGLRENAGNWQISKAIQDLKSSMSESSALKEAITNLERCQHNIATGLERLKQLTGEK